MYLKGNLQHDDQCLISCTQVISLGNQKALAGLSRDTGNDNSEVSVFASSEISVFLDTRVFLAVYVHAFCFLSDFFSFEIVFLCVVLAVLGLAL